MVGRVGHGAVHRATRSDTVVAIACDCGPLNRTTPIAARPLAVEMATIVSFAR